MKNMDEARNMNVYKMRSPSYATMDTGNPTFVAEDVQPLTEGSPLLWKVYNAST